MSSLVVEVDENEEVALVQDKREVELKRMDVKLPKPKLKPPTILERSGQNKKMVKAHYFTAGAKINDSNQRNIFSEPSPFKYPDDLEEFSYRVMSKAWRDSTRKKAVTLKVHERYSYSLRQNLDLLNRLYVKEPTTQGLKTIIELDPDFFTIVEGRPVDQKFNRIDYIADVRDVLRTKIITGYREDEIMLIEENFEAEQRLVEEITHEFQTYVNTFEEFLFNDHTRAMALLKQSEQEGINAAEKYEIFRNLSREYGSVKSLVYNLEEKWRRCKMCQKFLYMVSPIEWRKLHDFYHLRRGSNDDLEIEEDADSATVFNRYKLASSGNVLSLENLIDQYLDDVNIQNEPLLYFTDPQQLLKVFKFIEMQNLNSLLHSEELAVPLHDVKDSIEKMNTKFDHEMGILQEIIDSLEGGIIWEEERAKYLEELALELINGDFKKFISDDDVINLNVFVEDVYESRVNASDSNLTMSQMMKVIEITYRDWLLQLDRLPSYLVYRAEMECYKEEAKIMAVAIEAAKKVVQIERLMKHLAKLLLPRVYNPHRALVWRSPPKDKIKRPPPPPKPLTEEELDYLTYFVDFCSHTDDPKEYTAAIHKVEKPPPPAPKQD